MDLSYNKLGSYYAKYNGLDKVMKYLPNNLRNLEILLSNNDGLNLKWLGEMKNLPYNLQNLTLGL